MKNIEINSSHSFIKPTMFEEDYETSIKDKSKMRHLLHNTHLTKPGNIKIEAWAPGDESEIIAYERAAIVCGMGILFGVLFVANVIPALPIIITILKKAGDNLISFRLI